MHVTWAQGQTFGQYSHAPRSALEADKPSVPEFYKEDEIKYHGKKNRGHRSLQLISSEEESQCMFKYPLDCQDDCQYFASWQMVNDKVKFYVASTNVDRWMGIGISSNSFMVIMVLQ